MTTVTGPSFAVGVSSKILHYIIDEVEVEVTLTETLFILDITETKSKNCFFHTLKEKKMVTTVSGTDNLFLNL